MKKKANMRWLLSYLFLLGVVWLIPTKAYAQEDCILVGPLDSNFCGCTWGAVFYEGEPVSGADVSVYFGGVFTTTITGRGQFPLSSSSVTLLDENGNEYEAIDIEENGGDFPYPTYGVSAAYLPDAISAVRGDILTFVTTYAGQTVTRTSRALPGFEPDSMYEGSTISESARDALQNVNIVIPDKGVWSAQGTVDVGAVNDVVLVGETVWVAGANGVNEQRIDGTMVASHLDGVEIDSVAVGANEEVWVLDAESDQLHHYDGNENNVWNTIEITINATSMVVNMTNDTVIVGGADNMGGAIVEYSPTNTTWGKVTPLTSTAEAIAVDRNGTIWAGTGDNLDGVYRIAPDGTVTPFTKDDGLPTNRITHIESTDGFVYFGGSGDAILGRYNITTEEWFSWGEDSNLPSQPLIDLAIDRDDTVFAITSQGVHQLVAPNFWLTYTVSNTVAVATDGGVTIAAGTAIHQFDPEAFPGVPPTATISETQFISDTYILSGSGTEDEGDDSRIVGWEWMAGDTLLCNSASCEVHISELKPNTCSNPQLNTVLITLRVQDDEGEWSEDTETMLEVLQCPTSISLHSDYVNVVSLWEWVMFALVGLCVTTLLLDRRKRA